MVKLYTKTGDSGETSLVSGERLLKSDPSIDLYGEVDELNSVLGIAHAYACEKYRIIIERIQNHLFNLGSNLACSPDKRVKYKLPQFSKEDIVEIEYTIDEYQKGLPALKNFILPGGDPAAAFLQQARTIARRVERKMVALGNNPDFSLVYINRLSDLLFVMSRSINHSKSISETLWKK
jgi:cob(I)alamin adenosyltransferase